jgi:hypothetical protein
MFNEYDVIRLNANAKSIPLPAGTEGTVLLVFQDTPMAYEVEFVDENGESLGTYTVRENDLSLLGEHNGIDPVWDDLEPPV